MNYPHHLTSYIEFGIRTLWLRIQLLARVLNMHVYRYIDESKSILVIITHGYGIVIILILLVHVYEVSSLPSQSVTRLASA